jgi:hypothetical protein
MAGVKSFVDLRIVPELRATGRWRVGPAQRGALMPSVTSSKSQPY